MAPILQALSSTPLVFQQNYQKDPPLGVAQMPHQLPGCGTVAWLDPATSTEPWSVCSTAPMRVHNNPYRSLVRSPAHLRTRDYRMSHGRTRPWCPARSVSGARSLAPYASGTRNFYLRMLLGRTSRLRLTRHAPGTRTTLSTR